MNNTAILRTTVCSFDMFDTLVARACITSEQLLTDVGRATGFADFLDVRTTAEARLFETGCPFDLRAIYAAICSSGFCDTATGQRLMQAEIEAEFDNAIPISENIAAVQDFDLVVSDMYLPVNVLRGLLQHVGLRRHVHLFVSNAGKHRGTIWPALADRWLILQHTGDNIEADVRQARLHHVPARHFIGASPNPIEVSLHEAGQATLGRIARQLRLANPYVPGTVEAQLWNIFVQLNVPLLCLTSSEVRKQRDLVGKDSIFFLDRDCHFLIELFLVLYPSEPAELLYVSRKALSHDPMAYRDFLQANGLHKALVCDLVSTGYSWLRFRESTSVGVDFFSMIYIDNYQHQKFDSDELWRTKDFRFTYRVRSSEVTHWSLAIEALNTAPHGSAVALSRNCAGFVPEFEPTHELPRSLLECLILAQAAAVQCLRKHRSAVLQDLQFGQKTPELVGQLVSSISSTDWLNRLAHFAICQPTI